jgi:hypothetical protein
MAVLTGVVVLVGALGLLNLLLTFGVVRRLREYTVVLETLRAHGGPGRPVLVGDIPAPGAQVGEFTAITVDGEPVSRDSLGGSTAVVFMAAACKECRAQLPELVSWAGSQDRDRVLVVIDSDGLDTSDLVEPLSPVVRVIVERPDRPVINAFGVTAFPGSCVVNDGTVVASAVSFTELPALV